jgi:hypothetical protein
MPHRGLAASSIASFATERNRMRVLLSGRLYGLGRLWWFLDVAIAAMRAALAL